jgi:hypothetical protein
VTRPGKRALYAVGESGNPIKQTCPSLKASKSTLCPPGPITAEDEAVKAFAVVLAMMEPEEDRAYGEHEHEDGAEVEVKEIEVAVAEEAPEVDRARGEHVEEEAQAQAEAEAVEMTPATCCREATSKPSRTRP